MFLPVRAKGFSEWWNPRNRGLAGGPGEKRQMITLTYKLDFDVSSCIARGRFEGWPIRFFNRAGSTVRDAEARTRLIDCLNV